MVNMQLKMSGLLESLHKKPQGPRITSSIGDFSLSSLHGSSKRYNASHFKTWLVTVISVTLVRVW